jgi:hypothetical protein
VFERTLNTIRNFCAAFIALRSASCVATTILSSTKLHFKGRRQQASLNE